MRRKKRKTGKIIFTILILAAFCVSCAFVYEYFIANKPTKKPETVQEPTAQPVENPVTEQTEEKKEEGEVIGKDPIIQYEGENPNNTNSLTGVITYAGVSDQTLIIRLNIDQYLNSGSCKLSLSKNGAEYYSGSANIFADVSTSTCQGFNISTNNLPSGNYLITIELNSDNKTGIIAGSVNL